MNRRDPRTVTAVVNRERARSRLRAVTAGTGVLGLAVAGGLAFTLPGSTASTPAKSTAGSSSSHATAGGSGTSGSSSRSRSSSAGTSSSSSGSIRSSASAPSSSSGSASATSGGS